MPQDAIDLANQGITLAPTRVEAFTILAYMYALNGETPAAMQTIEHALSLAPSHPDVLFTLAIIHLQEGNIDEGAALALQALQKGATLKDAEALNWIINYYVQSGDTATVVFLYEQAIKIEPDNIELLPKLAAAYAAHGETQKAIETAQRYQLLNPQDADQVERFIKSLTELEYAP